MDILSALSRTSSVRGDQKTFLTHILGGQGIEACPHVSTEAIKDAKAVAPKKKTIRPSTIVTRVISDLTASRSDPELRTSNKRRRVDETDSDIVPLKMKQTSILGHTFNGVSMPFSHTEVKAIQEQALHVVVDANLAFGVWENVEMIKLVYMLRTQAPAIMPSSKLIGGTLLDGAAAKNDESLDVILRGQNIGLS